MEKNVWLAFVGLLGRRCCTGTVVTWQWIPKEKEKEDGRGRGDIGKFPRHFTPLFCT